MECLHEIATTGVRTGLAMTWIRVRARDCHDRCAHRSRNDMNGSAGVRLTRGALTEMT